VVRACAAAGWQVRALVRRMPEPGLLPAVTDVRLGDVCEAGTVEACMERCTAVIHAAGQVPVDGAEGEERYRRVNVAGMETVTEAARTCRVDRVVFFSSISVYGAIDDEPVTEENTPQPESPYGQSKLEAENIVLGARTSDGDPLGVVLRMASIYGPRMKGNYRRLLNSLQRGRFLGVGKGTNWRTLVFHRDAARAALLAAEREEAAGQVYNVSDGQLYRLSDIIIAMCTALGRNRPRFTVPLWPARLLAGAAEQSLGYFGKRSPVRVADIDKYTENQAVLATKIGEDLGFRAQYSLRDGWASIVEEMRATQAF